MKKAKVIMYNFPEPNIKNKDERMEKDLETINNFLTEGVKIGSMKIINAYRLGKYNDTKQGRPRPLRIIFEEKTQYTNCLKIYLILRNQKKNTEG